WGGRTRYGSRGGRLRELTVIHQSRALQQLHVLEHEGVADLGERADLVVAGAGPDLGDGGEHLAVGEPQPVGEDPVELGARGGGLLLGEPGLLGWAGLAGQHHAELAGERAYLLVEFLVVGGEDAAD